MKTTLLSLLTVLLFSCNQNSAETKNDAQLSEETETSQTNTATENEQFEAVNTDEINKLLAEKSESLSPEAVMKLFYPNEVETGEGNETITITETKTATGQTFVTLIHDNQLDDSQRGEKYVMELVELNDKWSVKSINRNWKCQEGRGHTDWGTDLCN